MVITTARIAAKIVVGTSGIIALLQGAAASGSESETMIWRWLPAVVVWAIGTYLLKVIGKDQGRSFLQSDDAREIFAKQQAASLKDYQFKLLLRDTIEQMFTPDIEKRDSYWDKVDMLENRTAGMANALSNIEGFAETQSRMQLAMNTIASTMGAMRDELKLQGKAFDKFQREWSAEIDVERRKEERRGGEHEKGHGR